jgi:hypothetical protein
MGKKKTSADNAFDDGISNIRAGAAAIEREVKAMKSDKKKSSPKGMSLHIGVNKLDPKCYPIDADDPKGSGWEGPLIACERDAKDMKKIADSQGYDSKLLLTKDATVKKVVKAIKKAAKKLSAGDSFFLTYSGHGGMVPDISGDEVDKIDETWCLYDRQFIDDELAALYAKFKEGVNIYVLSDSCHSGTVTKALPRVEPALTAEERKAIFGLEAPTFRLMTRETSMAVYYAREEFYDEIQNNVEHAAPDDIKANIRLISACQDDQEAADGLKNGKFTEVVKKTWADGEFDGGMLEFHEAIKGSLEAEYASALKGRPPEEVEELDLQIPNYNREGPDDPQVDQRRPFSI